MAAALRYAARRLGGRALQRLRFTTRTRSLTAEEKKDAASLLAEIGTKKEELYNLIARCERECVLGGSTGLQNGQLLEHLSHQVVPRPNDPHWRSCHRAATINHYIRKTGMLCITTMIMKGFIYLGKQVRKEYLGSQQEQ